MLEKQYHNFFFRSLVQLQAQVCGSDQNTRIRTLITKRKLKKKLIKVS